MIKILFVCHGNICRSPMAEFILKDMVEKRGIAEEFYIESAATSSEEIGNPVYPPARRKLAEHGISAAGKHARRMERADYERFDYILGMEQVNIRNMMRILGTDPQEKVHLLPEYSDRPGDIADPWYTGDFERTWQDITAGCEGFLRYLETDNER